MAGEDYYAILGVAKTANEDEVKRAFRKKAHELHPDKGGDAEAFKKLNEAYQTISDPQKRQQYDAFGSAGPGGGYGRQGGGGFEGFGFGGGFADIFTDMFSAAMANIQAEVQISVPQAVLGDSLELRVGNDRIKLDIPAGTQDGQAFNFRGKGQTHRSGRGDLTLIVRVVLPKRLSKRERELYEELKKLG
jgi:DnaJ-class molecular chaperone